MSNYIPRKNKDARWRSLRTAAFAASAKSRKMLPRSFSMTLDLESDVSGALAAYECDIHAAYDVTPAQVGSGPTLDDAGGEPSYPGSIDIHDVTLTAARNAAGEDLASSNPGEFARLIADVQEQAEAGGSPIHEALMQALSEQHAEDLANDQASAADAADAAREKSREAESSLMDRDSAWLSVKADDDLDAKDIAIGLGLALAPAAPANPKTPSEQSRPQKPRKPGYICPDKGDTWTCEEPHLKPRSSIKTAAPWDADNLESMTDRRELMFNFELTPEESAAALDASTTHGGNSWLPADGTGGTVGKVSWEIYQDSLTVKVDGLADMTDDEATEAAVNAAEQLGVHSPDAIIGTSGSALPVSASGTSWDEEVTDLQIGDKMYGGTLVIEYSIGDPSPETWGPAGGEPASGASVEYDSATMTDVSVWVGGDDGDGTWEHVTDQAELAAVQKAMDDRLSKDTAYVSAIDDKIIESQSGPDDDY